jgi:hypothetical protein
MNARIIDWIWHVRGSLPLTPGQTPDEAFDRLEPLFGEAGTSHTRRDATLTFTKKDQAAQDKMAVFDHGELRIEESPTGPILRYRLNSRALLLCFLAPLLFLGLAQLTVLLARPEKPDTAQVDASGKPVGKKKAERPMNPIDKALGMPAPEKPKDGDKDKKSNPRKPSTTPAYVFAGLFAALYVIGRFLEAWLIKGLFRKRLMAA